VPGLAYDRCGWRLGYGGGYYDRFLKNFTGASVGITYQSLLLGSIPHHAHDISMQWIVTEQELIQA
jgi:5-formyltetrahydrofolate cyclo-ligase